MENDAEFRQVKQVAAECKELLERNDPQVHRDGDDLTIRWIPDGLRFEISQVRHGSEGISCEVSINSTACGRLHWGRIVLASTSARETLIRKLKSSYSLKVDWPRILDSTCRIASERLRAGSPITALTGAPSKRSDRFLIERFLPHGETSVIFGDGGSGKSLLALSLAVAVSSGISLPCGLQSNQKSPVLYLDYETTQDEQNDRLWLRAREC